MDALKLIKHENPFPAVCGAICNRRCEDACTRGTIDQSVAIDEIKKFIAEQEINSANRFVPKVENHEGKEFTEKMAIIGAGPSGMSAAYYLREKGYPVTIFEKEQRAGGMLMNGIPSFRLEKSVIEEVVCTDTIRLPETGPVSKIRVLSMAETFATAIDRIYEQLPISDMFG